MAFYGIDSVLLREGNTGFNARQNYQDFGQKKNSAGLDFCRVPNLKGRVILLPEQPETRKMGKYKSPKLPETRDQNLRVPDGYFKLAFFWHFRDIFISLKTLFAIISQVLSFPLLLVLLKW